MTSRFDYRHHAQARACGAGLACLAVLARNPSHCPIGVFNGTDDGTPRQHWVCPNVPLKIGILRMCARVRMRARVRAWVRARVCTRACAANPDVWDNGTEPIGARGLAVPMNRPDEFNGTGL
jgi:hypothetical protein